MINNNCNRLDCRCTHTDGCERGFIYTPYLDRQEKRIRDEVKIIEKWYDGVRFCPICDPERAHIQATSTSSEELGQRLRNRSQFKHAENYETQEASKTRTL
jgi:hypothetical protein